MDPVSLSDSYRRDGLIRSFDALNDDEVQSIKLSLQTFIYCTSAVPQVSELQGVKPQ
jgi:hypothetical protein